ncbi:hypothetical protein Glove_48g41 [Diversispora epigaea]|uniref:Protein kinase domain-containing protein n=1 Tax=Diversispora epigaea TaxID=1348612 RepID=A0A397JQ29_9GLOM|nr:hypothetical protein Glove_48g41 [Diversispora epigaea]
MMNLYYVSGGNLRNYVKNIDWNNKLFHLTQLTEEFKKIHKLNIVHQEFKKKIYELNIGGQQDLHPGGNILSYNNFNNNDNNNNNNNNNKNKYSSLYITDFGVLPYIAPEVLSGEEYTKAADVYSFAFIAYELITGLRPYSDFPPHYDDVELSRKICNGLRPKIPFRTPKFMTSLIMRCWDARIKFKKKIYELNIGGQQDLHPGGNILSYNNFNNNDNNNNNNNNNKNKYSSLYITDFGVLPYIAPEVLSGEEYTKAADVYSFAFIAYELITGLRPYSDFPPHYDDVELSRKICNGLRPKIPFRTPKFMTSLIMRCWDARISYRPTFEELANELKNYYRI